MSNKEKPLDFLEHTKSGMEVLGFWTETYKSVLILQVERSYRRDVVRDWCVSDIVINGDKVLLRWDRRIFPLTEEELDKKYKSA